MTDETIACEPCREYWTRRHMVVSGAIAEASWDKPNPVPFALDLLGRFRAGVHRRHLAGLSLSTNVESSASKESPRIDGGFASRAARWQRDEERGR